MPFQKHKILFAIGSLAGGGAERQLITILQHLDRSHFEPHLYLISRQGELLHLVPDDVPVHSFDNIQENNLFYYPGRMHQQQVKHLTQVLTEQQIDLIYDRTYHATLISAPAARKTRTPRISVIVSEPARDLANQREQFLWFKQRLLHKAYAHADTVVTVSKSLAERVSNYYQIKHVVPILNSFDFEAIAARAIAFQPELSPDGFHIVSAGRLSPEKNFSMFIQAANKLVKQGYPQVQLHILGQGPQEQELKTQVRAGKLENFVQFHGYVENPFPWYHSAQLSCLCSNYEGSPNTLIEAMACETPVIATDCPCGPAEILEAGRFGALVPVNDVDALAKNIANAIDHYPNWKQVASQAKIHVEKKYSASTNIKALEELLVTLLT